MTLILKAYLFVAFFLTFALLSSAQHKPGYVLVLIDIQDFYFPDGGYELSEPGAASTNAAALLQKFRETGLPVIHIRHNSKSNAGIHKSVTPTEGETVISKHHANGFLNTALKEKLDEAGADSVVICGMQTHMCVEATTRAASDLGYKCIIAEDACTTRDLFFFGTSIPARLVHLSTLATLSRTYARITSTEEMLLHL